jgi:hypothetical protein
MHSAPKRVSARCITPFPPATHIGIPQAKNGSVRNGDNRFSARANTALVKSETAAVLEVDLVAERIDASDSAFDGAQSGQFLTGNPRIQGQVLHTKVI